MPLGILYLAYSSINVPVASWLATLLWPSWLLLDLTYSLLAANCCYGSYVSHWWAANLNFSYPLFSFYPRSLPSNQTCQTCSFYSSLTNFFIAFRNQALRCGAYWMDAHNHDYDYLWAIPYTLVFLLVFFWSLWKQLCSWKGLPLMIDHSILEMVESLCTS